MDKHKDGGVMSRKTYRVRLQLDGDPKPQIYRTDGKRTYCCELSPSLFLWEKNTKYNGYDGWSGYVAYHVVENSLESYDPDNLRGKLCV